MCKYNKISHLELKCEFEDELSKELREDQELSEQNLSVNCIIETSTCFNAVATKIILYFF